jgi:hypothetical protein
LFAKSLGNIHIALVSIRLARQTPNPSTRSEINCALFLQHGQTKIAQDERKFLTPRKALE